MNDYKRLLTATGTLDMIRAAVNDELAGSELSKSEQRFINSEIEIMLDDMCGEMSKLFTPEEVAQLADFYETDLGKKMLSKTQDIVHIASKCSEKYMLRIMQMADCEDDSHEVSVLN